MTIDYTSLPEKIQNQEIIVVDFRANPDFLASHIPGAVNVPYNSYGWARAIKQWLDGYDIELGLVGDNDNTANNAENELKSVGLNVTFVISDALADWKDRQLPVSSVSEISPDELYSHIDRWTVIDVREPYEWQSGTIKNSIKIPMNEIPNRLSEFNRSDKYAVICAHGNRSEVIALFLADKGLQSATVAGGINRWLREQKPVEYEY